MSKIGEMDSTFCKIIIFSSFLPQEVSRIHEVLNDMVMNVSCNPLIQKALLHLWYMFFTQNYVRMTHILYLNSLSCWYLICSQVSTFLKWVCIISMVGIISKISAKTLKENIIIGPGLDCTLNLGPGAELAGEIHTFIIINELFRIRIY